MRSHSPKRKKIDGGLSCEIVSDLCPNPLSHDWHVQPSCQRPNRLPPERRAFSPGGPARMRIRLSSKPYKHIVRAKPCQRMHPTAFPRVFPHATGQESEPSAAEARLWSRAFAARLKSCPSRFVLVTARNDIVLRSGFTKTPDIRRTPKRKTEN